MTHSQLRSLLLALLVAGFCCSLSAVDGVILIDQNRALAGNVTPGDTPGFPVTISQPGSYRLSGNLTAPNVNTTAISITADGVTLDLNGFSIIGPVICQGAPPACSPGGPGTGIESINDSVTVVNGSVHGMGNFGIYMGGLGSRIERVHANSNTDGISIFSGVLIGDTATRNRNGGIITTGPVTVSGTNSVGNGGWGYDLVCPTAMIGNTAKFNAAGNVITAGAGCTFTGNAP